MGHTKENCKVKIPSKPAVNTAEGGKPVATDVGKQTITIDAGEGKKTQLEWESIPENLGTEPSLVQPPPEPNLEIIPDNLETEQSLAHPPESIPELPPLAQLGEANRIASAELRSKL